MKIEIDQSGKIENTERHTYIALSNHIQIVLKIKSTEKKKLQQYFRLIGKPRKYVLFSFTALIIILLKKIRQKELTIIIDKEYSGKDNQLKDLLFFLYPKLKQHHVYIRSIGKKSNAHYLVYGAALSQTKPDVTVSASDVIEITKKPGSA